MSECCEVLLACFVGGGGGGGCLSVKEKCSWLTKNNFLFVLCGYFSGVTHALGEDVACITV